MSNRHISVFFFVCLFVGCSSVDNNGHQDSVVSLDQFSIVKGYPGNSFSRDDEEKAPINLETYCVAWSDPNPSIECWQLVVRRGIAEFDISNLPHNKVVSVMLTYVVRDADRTQRILIAPTATQPTHANDTPSFGDLFSDLGYDGHSGDQTRYYGFLDKGQGSVTLNENAIADLQSAIDNNQSWFGIGFRHQDDLSCNPIVSPEPRCDKSETLLDGLTIVVTFE